MPQMKPSMWLIMMIMLMFMFMFSMFKLYYFNFKFMPNYKFHKKLYTYKIKW
uniref:ATP synthase subunit 8 n=1 Tax=Coelioxys fenestrata TaxID=621226 RepID=A0A7T4WNW5_9HYME|nr:ATP synthase F0 subunit 8 [Coelioxys fenestrata]QQD78146.1 ATP synthase subunit 8 [Coelioxys fenestrata]